MSYNRLGTSLIFIYMSGPPITVNVSRELSNHSPQVSLIDPSPKSKIARGIILEWHSTITIPRASHPAKFRSGTITTLLSHQQLSNISSTYRPTRPRPSRPILRYVATSRSNAVARRSKASRIPIGGSKRFIWRQTWRFSCSSSQSRDPNGPREIWNTK